jgi:hypothetical protein
MSRIRLIIETANRRIIVEDTNRDEIIPTLAPETGGKVKRDEIPLNIMIPALAPETDIKNRKVKKG